MSTPDDSLRSAQMWQPQSVNSIGERFGAIALVIGIHVLGVLALVTHKVVVRRDAPPIEIVLLQAPASSEPPPPVPVEVPLLQAPLLPTAITPEVVTMTEPASAITVAVQPVIADVAPAHAPQEPIVEARFDVDYLNNPQPAYPALAKRMREQGLVVLKVKVRADGTPDAVLVQQHSGSARLDEAAMAAVKRWKFVPARRGDQPVVSWVLVPIEFELKA